MSLSVARFYETTRQEGLNCGLPMTFVELGPGTYYTKVEDFVGTILQLANCKWVCLVGDGTTQAGMGPAARGLWQCGFSTEFELEGSRKDPSWLNSVTKWIIDYTRENTFNFGSLRSGDAVRFPVSSREDFELAQQGFEELAKMPMVKYIRFRPDEKLSKQDVGLLATDCIDFLKKYDRARLF